MGWCNGFKNFVWNLFHKNDLKMRHAYALSNHLRTTERTTEIQSHKKSSNKII